MKSVSLKKLQNSSEKICQALKVISNPDRLTIIVFLSKGEKSVGEIEIALNISQPTLSQQLTVLRKGNFVSSRRSGKNIFYELKARWVLNLVDLLFTKIDKKN